MRWIYYGSTVLLLLALAYLCSLIWIPLLGGLILAFLLYPLLGQVERLGMGRALSVSATLILTLILLVGMASMILPALVEQIQAMVSQKDALVRAASSMVSTLDSWMVLRWGSEGRDQVHGLVLDKSRHLLSALGEQVPATAMHLLSTLGNLLLAPVIAFFFLYEGRQIYKAVLSRVPQRSFELVARLLQQSGSLVGAYLRGQLLDCACVAALLWAGLSMIGVQGALAIAVLSGLLNAVPYVGPLIGLLLCYLSFFADPSASYSWWSLALIFVLVMKVDGYLIYPGTVGRALKLNAFVVMLSLMAGGALAGILGMVIATPLLALIMESMRQFRKTLIGYREI